MPTQVIDFRKAGVPKLETGVPVGRGFLHSLLYQGKVNLAVDDHLEIWAKVPNDEHWYVQQWSVLDFTNAAGNPNGWRALTQWLELPRWKSVTGVAGTPAQGAWTEDTNPDTVALVWTEWWDGVTPIAWEDFTALPIASIPRRLIRCTDPVWSFPRWPASSDWTIKMYTASEASGDLRKINTIVNVVRFREEDADFKRLMREDGSEFLLHDIHMEAHRPILGQ